MSAKLYATNYWLARKKTHCQWILVANWQVNLFSVSAIIHHIFVFLCASFSLARSFQQIHVEAQCDPVISRDGILCHRCQHWRSFGRSVETSSCILRFGGRLVATKLSSCSVWNLKHHEKASKSWEYLKRHGLLVVIVTNTIFTCKTLLRSSFGHVDATKYGR